MRVAALGDNCLDVYLGQNLVTVGGNALNVAVGWAQAGLAASYYGAVGTDQPAAIVRAVMRDLGLDPQHVESVEGVTGVTLIRLINGDREFVFEEFGVGGDWKPPANVVADLRAFDWIHVGGPLARAEVAQALARNGARTSVDLSTSGDFGDLAGIEVAFAAYEDQIDEGAYELADRVISAGAKSAVVTCGPYGSLVRRGSQAATTPALPLTPVDTCGAGDSYIAAFIGSHIRGLNSFECLAEATRAATATCLHIGSVRQPPLGIPDWLRRDYPIPAQEDSPTPA